MITEKELELRDYLEVMIKRKILIIWGTVFCVLAVLFWAWWSASYEVTATFRNAYFIFSDEVGGKWQKSNFVDGREVVSRIMSPEILDPVLAKRGRNFEEFRNLTSVENIRDNTGDSNLFQIKMRSKNLLEAKEIMTEWLRNFFKYVQPLVAEKKKRLQEELDKTNKEIETLAPLLKKTESRLLLMATASGGLEQTTWLVPVYQEQRDCYKEAQAKRALLEEQLVNIYDFEVLLPPATSGAGFFSRITKMIIIGGVLGLVFFICLAFFLEYWMSSKSPG